MQHDRRRRADWVPLLPGIYRFASAPPTFRMRCMAAVLWSEPDGLISHSTAAALWELEGVTRPAETHLTVPVQRGLTHELVEVHRCKALLPADRSVVHAIAATSPLRTVLDLASLVDELTLELAIEDALRRGLFSVGQLEWRAAGRSGKGFPGSKVVADLVARHGTAVTDSGWEVRLGEMLVERGFPRPVRQLKVQTGARTYRVDLGYPGPPVVAFEYDSDRWHSGVGRRHADARRRNALRAAGCVVIEVNAGLMKDALALVEMVAAVLRSAGASV